MLQWKESGYSIYLRHDGTDTNEESRVPGFHIYLHEPREKFTEHGILSTGRIEYLYLDVNEEMELKLTVQHFNQFRGRGSTCSNDEFKSLSIVRSSDQCLSFLSKRSYYSAVKCVDGDRLKTSFLVAVHGWLVRLHLIAESTKTSAT